MPVRLRAGVAVLVAAALSFGARAEGQAADVSIRVRSGGHARVEASYTLAPQPVAELRWLQRACASIEGLRVEKSGVPISAVSEDRVPWVILRDTSASSADSLRWSVSYDVRVTGGAGDIPIVHPAASFTREGAGEGAVHIAVTFTGGSGRVAFPHMSRDSGGRWSAHYVAVPSFVEVASDEVPSSACESRVSAPAGDGGLSWRFFLLVGIMVLWVPIYQLWARRMEAPGA